MAMISVRDLQRNAKDIFDKVEGDSEPMVITRRGRPIAALMPVNQIQAEAILVSTSAEFIESREHAENARSEGRTVSLQQVLSEATEQLGENSNRDMKSRSRSYLIFDDSLKGLKEWVGVNADAEVERLSHDVTRQAVEAVIGQSPVNIVANETWQKTIHSMNYELARLNLYKELLELVHVQKNIFVSHSGSQKSLDKLAFEPRHLECAFLNTKTLVERINGNFVVHFAQTDPDEFRKLFEAGLHGAVISAAGELEEVQKGRDAASLTAWED